MIRVSCPKCKGIVQVEDKQAGQVIACSTCKTSLRLPQAPPAPLPPPPVVVASPSPSIPTAIPTMPVTAEWYYANGDKQLGPITEEELRVLATSGKLLPADMVWKQGMSGWATASSISALFPRTSQAPPPLPPVVAAPTKPSKIAANRVTCELDLPGQDGPHQVDLLLDGEKIATGSWQAGIHNLQFESAIGSHTFTLQLTATVFGASRTGKKEYQVQFKKPGHYTLKFKYGWMPMQLPTGIESSYSPEALDFVPVSAMRKKSFVGSWQPTTEANVSLQFTEDGAVVFSDGSAGRFTISGNQPNEVIEIKLVNGQSRQFKVVSLSPEQLVVAEGNEATTFRRPKKPPVSLPPPAQQTGHPVGNAPNPVVEAMVAANPSTPPPSQETPETPATRYYYDCPNCGKTYYNDWTTPTSVDGNQRIDCSGCNRWFLVQDAINFRTTPERVEENGFLKRLWSGSSISKTNREKPERVLRRSWWSSEP